ncbi:MAG: hypothetical protein ACFBSG_10465 [Leptolyngbyaceae cyanobacterium]
MNRPRPIADRLLRLLSSPRFWLTLYGGLGLIGVFNHAMWRDEFNTWLIVRDSSSLGEMLQHVKYQGHTALWATCLAALRQIYDSYRVMQLLHWAIALLSVGVFWRYSPFTQRQKILFTFGYIPFYQYLNVARPYVLGMFCLFVFCAIFPWRRRSYVPAAIVIALMANSSAYGLLIALALVATLAIELGLDSKVRSQYLETAHPLDWAMSLAIITAGLSLAIYILTPPADSYNHGGLDAWKLDFNLRRGLRAWGRIFAGYTLIVPSQYRWVDLLFCGLLTVGTLTVFAFQLVKRNLALIFFGLANLILLAFSYFRFAGIGPRHFAHFYLILIAAFWLFAYLPESNLHWLRTDRPAERLLAIAQQSYQPLLTTILVLQFLGGLYVFPRDLLIPFSAGKATAAYMQAAGLDQAFIVASRDANMAPIAGYLNRQLYYPELAAMGSFTLFGGDREFDNHENYISHGEVLTHVQMLLEQRDEPRLLLTLHLPLDATNDDLKITPIAEFTHSWTRSERYYLYWVEKAPPTG